MNDDTWWDYNYGPNNLWSPWAGRQPSVLGIILARAGSQRLPGKNTRPLAGLPMIGWTILAAKQARSLSGVVVSSDCDKVLEIARRCEVTCIRRPAELATSTASPYDAIRHAYEAIGLEFDLICLMQPTSPLRTFEDIDACTEMAKHSKTHAVSCEEGKEVPNGAVYVGSAAWVLGGGNFDHHPMSRYYMPAEKSVDVDTIADFERAEALMLAA